MKKNIFLVFLISLFFLVSCSSNSPAGSSTKAIPSSSEIYYTVTGSMSSALSISYNRGGGNQDLVSGQALPYTSPTMTFAKSDWALVTCSNASGGSMVVNIYKDGVLWKTNTASSGGGSVMVSVDGQV